MTKFKNQKEMFLKIWEEREHVSEVSGKPLLHINHPQWHWQICHILSKGAYPAYKLREENIMLMLPEEHMAQETYSKFIERRDELKRQYYEEKTIKRNRFK